MPINGTYSFNKKSISTNNHNLDANKEGVKSNLIKMKTVINLPSHYDEDAEENINNLESKNSLEINSTIKDKNDEELDELCENYISQSKISFGKNKRANIIGFKKAERKISKYIENNVHAEEYIKTKYKNYFHDNEAVRNNKSYIDLLSPLELLNMVASF